MGEVLPFPSHEEAIVNCLKALLEAAEQGVLLAFVCVAMDQDGEHEAFIVGEIDEPEMISRLNAVKREIKRLE